MASYSSGRSSHAVMAPMCKQIGYEYVDKKSGLIVACRSFVGPVCKYVTGFWKTDQSVTLGLFHFIGQTNCYTRTLHIHSVSIRLG